MLYVSAEQSDTRAIKDQLYVQNIIIHPQNSIIPVEHCYIYTQNMSVSV